jgi:polar amino acid transport system permease protein/octopine/nopaline transport system permease protein/arginine/ornithine transport system permease protein
MFDLRGYGHLLFQGLWLTLELSICSFVIAIALGLVGAVGKISSNRLAHSVADLYTIVVRGIPELVLLLLLYYGGTVLIQNFARAVFEYPEPLDINRFLAGTLVLGFVYGAFATEVFRGAFQSIPIGQLDAARACGMNRAQIFWRIRLPQAWRFAIPGLGNVWLVLVKATAITSAIGLTELTGQAVVIKVPTRQPFLVFLMAAALYLTLTALSDLLRHRLERRVARGMQRGRGG